MAIKVKKLPVTVSATKPRIETKKDLLRYKRDMVELRQELENKEAAETFLKKAGIFTRFGNLAPRYR